MHAESSSVLSREMKSREDVMKMPLCVRLRCFPWLEADAGAAGRLVGLYAHLTAALHLRFRGGSPAAGVHQCECVFICTVQVIPTGAAVCSRPRAPRPERRPVAVRDALL